MRKKNNQSNRFLALLLAASIGCGAVAVPGVFAQKTDETDIESLSEDVSEEETEGLEDASEEAEESRQETEKAEGLDQETEETKESEAAAEVKETEENTESESAAGAGETEESKADTDDEAKTESKGENGADTANGSETKADTKTGISAATPSEAAKTETQTGEAPYRLSVFFDGSRLEEATDNLEWNGESLKPLEITVIRDTAQELDLDSNYILTVNLSDLFYFESLPSAENIKGVKRVSLLRHEAPEVEISGGTKEALSDFNRNTGKLCLELDSEEEDIVLPVLEIGYQPQLAGYMGVAQEIEAPVSISLASTAGVDILESDDAASEEQIANEDDTEKIFDICQITSLSLLTEAQTDVTVNTTMTVEAGNAEEAESSGEIALLSLENAEETVWQPELDGQTRVLGPQDSFYYACGLSGLKAQVYDALKIVFQCPYITVEGTDYYLKFSEADEALLENRQGENQAYTMAEPAVYDAASHTITYTFRSLYLEEDTVLFYTPVFSWPEDEALEELSVTENTVYDIKGCGWKIAEQTSYTGSAIAFQTIDGAEETAVYAVRATENGAPLAIDTITFDGIQLKEESTGEENRFEDNWTNTESRSLRIKIKQNPSGKVEDGKKYVLCVKVPETFYFNGLPEAEKITGVTSVAMVKNTAPQVQKYTRAVGPLESFSPYSGEIRMELNPVVNEIDITNISISYNVELAGYVGEQDIEDFLQAELVSVDNSVSLSGMSDTDKSILETYVVDSVHLKTPTMSEVYTEATNHYRMAVSGLGFASGSNTTDFGSLSVGKQGTIAYRGDGTGISGQVYKELTLVFHCPYIVVNNKNYYLSFSTDPAKEMIFAGTVNGQGAGRAFTMSQAAEYDAEQHTITYYFKDIYMDRYRALFYTPVFSWPTDEEIKDVEPTDAVNYPIKGCDWEITKQTSYTGQESTLQAHFILANAGRFVQSQSNVILTSSAQSPASGSLSGIGKRNIYKDVTRENGVTGVIGFYDIHNTGASDSPQLKLTYKFNTDSDDEAKYYVTRVSVPAYQNTGGTDVSYILSNGESGTKHYSNTSSFSIAISQLTSADGVYIEELSYTTSLSASTSYHSEIAHAYRNRPQECGTFEGYLEGEVGSSAHATLTIASVDGITAINKAGDTEITTKETSTVAGGEDDDFIGFRNDILKIDGSNTKSITAGDSTVLSFSGIVSGEEYYLSGTKNINGYHIFRDGIFYICLPDGVSIPGTEQVKVSLSGRSVSVEAVKKLDASCTVDGKTAYWWQITVPNLNAGSNKTFAVQVKLATNETMPGVNWSFQNAVAIRVKDQHITWNSSSLYGTVYDTINSLKRNTDSMAQSLASYLEQDGATRAAELGLQLYERNMNMRLNIVRAEAKLDVETSLQASTDTKPSSAVLLSSPDTELDYKVVVSSNDGGSADEFFYYIPVVNATAAVDTNAWVLRKDFNLKLNEAVDVTQLAAGQSSGTETWEDTFQVAYTTAEGLNSTTIQDGSVTWLTADQITDYSRVTAVRIATKDGAEISKDESYQFRLKLEYNNSGNDFENQAGNSVGWRSFGRYTYTRNGETTTNTYPHAGVYVTACYESDLTGAGELMEMVLKTDAADNYVDVIKELSWEPVKAQTLKVKKIVISNGTQFITTDPQNLSGADANSKFRLTLTVNSGTEAVLTESGSSASWTVGSGQAVKLTANVAFSKALTDSSTERYVDVTLGNDYVDIVCRIKLTRQVAAVDATGSGTAVGAHYQVTKVGDGCDISQDSAFTALYVIENFVPANFDGRRLIWKTGSSEAAFPENTAITMMVISQDSRVESYWYYKADGSSSSVDLTQFTRMGGSETFTYDTTTVSGVTLRYQFAVDFGGTAAGTGSYSLAFGADSTGTAQFKNVELPVMLEAATDYTLTNSGETSGTVPAAKASYTVTQSAGNDSYSERKTLALVLTPETGTQLPADGRIKAGDTEYTRNSDGNFVIPIGTIQSGEKELSLVSDMFPDAEQTYTLAGQLYLSNSTIDKTPMNGEKVSGPVDFNFKKADVQKPALKVSGTQVAAVENWAKGQDFAFEVLRIPVGGSVTVTAYTGLTGSQRATALLSSVSGIFDVTNGVGIYDSAKAPTEQLVLNGSAAPGTYRLIFEMKNSAGDAVLTVPYYLIVR